MKVRVLAIGRDRSGLFAPAVEEYLQRLRRSLKVELVELPEARKLAGTPQAREEEGASLLARLRPG
jgi:23S rRNA (pseudouridine1915-N3)-methyltransferase